MPFGSNATHGDPPKPQPVGGTSPAKTDDLFAERQWTQVASGHLAHSVAAGAEICRIDGFRMQNQTDEYRLDFMAMYDSAAGPASDIQLLIDGVPYMTIPVPAAANVPITGTLFLTAGNYTLSLAANAGSASGNYAGYLLLTRLKQGFRVG